MRVGEQLQDRFRDPLSRVQCFADEVLVKCPACGDCAVVLANLGEREVRRKRHFEPPKVRRRLRCPACGLFKDEWHSEPLYGAAVDPYFRLPLWLQEDCRGHVLWAYNARHLDRLESYIAARLRERGRRLGSMSMVERLPTWMKSSKNRDDVLRIIRRLRTSLPTSSTAV